MSTQLAHISYSNLIKKIIGIYLTAWCDIKLYLDDRINEIHFTYFNARMNILYSFINFVVMSFMKKRDSLSIIKIYFYYKCIYSESGDKNSPNIKFMMYSNKFIRLI